MLRKLFITSLLSAAALAGPPESKTVAPPAEDQWEFKLSLPAWIPWITGESGLNGHMTDVDLSPDDIIPRWDMVADVRAEAHKGRFSVMGEFLYMSLSDGVGTNTVVKKLDFQTDNMMADLALGWRIIETPRGWVEVIGGVRYTNYYQKVALQPNDEAIGGVSSLLAGASTALDIARELSALNGKDPTVPIAPLDADEARQLARAVNRVKGTAAERKDKIEKLLHDALSKTVSRLDDWWDPYIGARGRYNLNDKWYLTARADIGGFTIGSDLSWTAEAALGFQMTPRIFNEFGYRALGVDYDKDGLTMRTVTHGPQMTVGITF